MEEFRKGTSINPLDPTINIENTHFDLQYLSKRFMEEIVIELIESIHKINKEVSIELAIMRQDNEEMSPKI